jgi:glucokinase
MSNFKSQTRSHITPAQPARVTIGVEFDLHQFTAAMVDDRARVMAEQRSEIQHIHRLTTRSAVSTIAELILNLASCKERGTSVIGAIGISVPGLVDPGTERVSISGLKGWTRVALQQMIEGRLSEMGHDIRTPMNEKRARAQHSISPHPAMVIHTHSSCAAVAESWIGAARGKKNVIYLSLGEWIDVGILADGRVIRGAGGIAGSAGWLALSENFRREYEAAGCLAAEASSGSLTRRAIEEWNGSSNSILGKLIKSDPAQLEPATIIRAARGGDPLALKVVNETCRWIGRGIANMASILNPEAVVIGGHLGLSLKPFFSEVRDEVSRWVGPQISSHCRIINAAVVKKAGLVGAARLAWLKSTPQASS